MIQIDNVERLFVEVNADAEGYIFINSINQKPVLVAILHI